MNMPKKASLQATHEPHNAHLDAQHSALRAEHDSDKGPYRKEGPGLANSLPLLIACEPRKALVRIEHGALAVADEDAIAHVVESAVAKLKQPLLLLPLRHIVVRPDDVHDLPVLNHRAHLHLQRQSTELSCQCT